MNDANLMAIDYCLKPGKTARNDQTSGPIRKWVFVMIECFLSMVFSLGSAFTASAIEHENGHANVFFCLFQKNNDHWDLRGIPDVYRVKKCINIELSVLISNKASDRILELYQDVC